MVPKKRKKRGRSKNRKIHARDELTGQLGA
jgi:hypothetical protein